jgi:hypothetical protein
MEISLPQNMTLPNWTLIFAFFASAFLTLLKIFEIILKSVEKPSLELVLTRDVFYRLLDPNGESLYVNVVLLSHEADALIREIKASLDKTNQPKKSFELRVAQIGEKYRNPDGSLQFCFHSTSPLIFVTPNNPIRQSYICEQESYSAAIQNEFRTFTDNLYKIQEKYEPLLKEIPTDHQNEEVRSLVEELQSASNHAHSKIMESLQIETGDYVLNIQIKYRQKGKFKFYRTKYSKASIRFTVDENARDIFRYRLNEYLQIKTRNVLLKHNIANIPIDYVPSNIREI